VIAFGSLIADGEAYRRYAQPGVRSAAEPDSAIFNFAAVTPTGRGLNLILAAAAACEDLEALVLVSPHTEITAADPCAVIRDALSDESVAVVGSVGATGVRSIAWWEGQVVSAQVAHRYQEHRGGELPALSWTQRAGPPAEVETLDGQLLVLSPWAVRNLRFDESLALGVGYDLDFCLTARAAGRTLAVVDLPITQHHSLELVPNLEIWIEAHIAVARKWGDVLHGPQLTGPQSDEQWKQRARWAEARREVSRAVAFSGKLRRDVQVEELERQLKERTSTRSWQLTRPLREFNLWRRSRGRIGPMHPGREDGSTP
jgi:hypothetical protein